MRRVGGATGRASFGGVRSIHATRGMHPIECAREEAYVGVW